MCNGWNAVFCFWPSNRNNTSGSVVRLSRCYGQKGSTIKANNRNCQGHTPVRQKRGSGENVTNPWLLNRTSRWMEFTMTYWWILNVAFENSMDLSLFVRLLWVCDFTCGICPHIMFVADLYTMWASWFENVRVNQPGVCFFGNFTTKPKCSGYLRGKIFLQVAYLFWFMLTSYS